MKRISIIIMTLELLVALTQCKKEQNTKTIVEETVAITLAIKGNEGSRMDVNTGTGEVTYECGDVIYVASGGKYIGTLTHNGSNFGGTVTNPTVGEPLYFYFFGNVEPAETLTAGTTQSCSVVINDQTEHLPVIECAPSCETYNSGVTTFTAFLLNKCALVKFNVVTASEVATCVMGLNNKVTVDFTDASFSYSKTEGGNIILPAGSGEKWAILLPQEAMEEGEVGSAYSVDGEYIGKCGPVPAIADNGFLTNGIVVTVNTSATSIVPTGAINGLFTINTNGDQVYFSQGNLQYIGSAATPYWKFADNQWDCFGRTTGQNSTNQNVDRDLFGWGTSGYDHGANCYQPWSTSTSSNDYFAYGNSSFNLYDHTGQADWGYNLITNGGNQENQWRTLTLSEWNYVFNIRSTISGVRFAKANVNSINGVILLPDDWNISTYTLNNTNFAGASFGSNTITAPQWAALESVGAIFLPAAGLRNYGTSVSYVGSYSYYWSASCSDSNHAYNLFFYDSSLGTSSGYTRSNGFSVRLVHDTE